MISLQNVKKSFGPNHVLRGVDITVDQGQSLTVIGGSGTGKSVLMRAIIGLQPVAAGDVEVFGKSITGADPEGLKLLNELQDLFYVVEVLVQLRLNHLLHFVETQPVILCAEARTRVNLARVQSGSNAMKLAFGIWSCKRRSMRSTSSPATARNRPRTTRLAPPSARS